MQYHRVQVNKNQLKVGLFTTYDLLDHLNRYRRFRKINFAQPVSTIKGQIQTPTNTMSAINGFSEDQASKEFGYSEKDFARVQSLIYKKVGISLAESKAQLVYSRISRLLRATGHKSFSAYLDFLEADQSGVESESFINAMTTNLTSFFREMHHFTILAEQLKSTKQPINIWCSACSTGEEAYSIAMIACEVFNTMTPPVHIIATDVDTNAVSIAKEGIYTVEKATEMLSDQRLKRFFFKGIESQSGSIKVRDALQQIITFDQFNLVANPWKIKTQFDAIFCRNVMIYFDKQTQTKVLERFIPLIKPNGLLYAGHSENFSRINRDLLLRGKTVYSLVANQK
jgi:chemotaxis protein methyltransferase CheR